MPSGFRLRRLIAIIEMIKMMIAATIITATSTRYNGVGFGGSVGVGDGDTAGVGDTVGVGDGDTVGVGDDAVVGDGVGEVGVAEVIAKVALMVWDAWMLLKVYEDAAATGESSTIKEAME